MPRFTIHRRTFEARNLPKGSHERARLNESVLTSEYMPSYRYAVADSENERQAQSFRSKSEAETYADRWNA